MTAPLLRVNHIFKHYALPRERLFTPSATVQALRGVSLEVRAGCNVGIVGESGSGKSTLARLVMALEAPSSGSIQLLGLDIHKINAIKLRESRRDFQMVFQDPYGSLDPRQTVARIVAEPLTVHAEHTTKDLQDRATEVLLSVGLRLSDAAKYPHEFSGGQRQRIAIARALITRPKLIVADEPVSALDVSVQAQVLNLMMDLQDQFGMTYLFISHDLAVVQQLCDEVVVLQQGQVVERGTPAQLFTRPQHPYTQALVGAANTRYFVPST
jgi:ABC-type oligopeptide transport system ATPase subunit